jgi:Uma2 family endonuclease
MPREITLPEAKPALEWVNGRVLQKMSPKRRHAVAQGRFFAALDEWAHDGQKGIVGTEWRFRVQPPGEERRPLVPDVAYLSYARLSYQEQQVTDEPKIAPDALVEVLSPGDRRADVEEKIRVYLAAGSSVIFIVDPKLRRVQIRDARGERTIEENGVLTHDALAGFRLDVRRLFSMPVPKSE